MCTLSYQSITTKEGTLQLELHFSAILVGRRWEALLPGLLCCCRSDCPTLGGGAATALVDNVEEVAELWNDKDLRKAMSRNK